MAWDRMRYRSLVDELVESCRFHVRPADAADLLARLSPADRETLVELLSHAFVSGVHETLRVLHDAEVEPFDHAEEGTPFMDLMGRLQGLEWPEESG